MYACVSLRPDTGSAFVFQPSSRCYGEHTGKDSGCVSCHFKDFALVALQRFYFPLKFYINVILSRPQLSFKGLLEPKMKFHPFSPRHFIAGVTFSNSYNRAEEKAGKEFRPLPTQCKT